MTPQTRALLADLAASLLLAALFVIFVLAAVAAYLVVSGLRIARREAPLRLDRAAGYAREAATYAVETSTAVIAPQVRLVSTWAGVRAGVRSLLGRGPSNGSAEQAGGSGPPETSD